MGGTRWAVTANGDAEVAKGSTFETYTPEFTLNCQTSKACKDSIIQSFAESTTVNCNPTSSDRQCENLSLYCNQHDGVCDMNGNSNGFKGKAKKYCTHLDDDNCPDPDNRCSSSHSQCLVRLLLLW